MRLRAHNTHDWQLVDASGRALRRRRSSGVSGVDVEHLADMPAAFLLDGVAVAETKAALPRPAQRGTMARALEIDVDCAPGERAVIATRHASNALTFHAPIEAPRRRGGGTATRRSGATAHFRIAPRPALVAAPDGRVRRGLVTQAFKVVVLKVREALIDAAVKKATAAATQALERLWWKSRGLPEGWLRVDAASLRAGTLKPASMPKLGANERALVLIHGTFSHAGGAFAGLASAPGNFFEAARDIYGDRIFAFNHLSLSCAPADNAKALLEGLPSGGRGSFDVITHSRGGLVLRHLVERRDLFGPLADRFRLGRAVLVASPNTGTPLATSKRWEETIGLIANILEMFPDNPWTTAPELVANGIVWLAGHLTKDLPGLAAMDANGGVITALQSGAGAPTDKYSALVANYHPEGAFLSRLVDAGIDAFFAGANDLVVPSEGGWDVAADMAIPAERIGCFGAGGNLSSTGAEPVTHVSFFNRKETIEFLVRSLRGEPAVAHAMELDRPLPVRRSFRDAAVAALPAASAARRADAPRAEPQLDTVAEMPQTGAFEGGELQGERTLHLMILGGQDKEDLAQIVATYGSARVVQPFPTSKRSAERVQQLAPALADQSQQAGRRFQRIIATHERIRMNLEGRPEQKSGIVPDLPNDEELRDFGAQLFDALFHGDVKRLYDVARSEQTDRPLNLVLTCRIPWIAAKPWEFAYDAARRKFLVTEEVHFVRNVFTPVPAQRLLLNRNALRMLVVVAQPLGTVELSTDDEEARIRHGFRALLDAGLVEIDVLTEATPARLHRILEARALESQPGRDRSYQIVHFIGHGDFDKDANQGILLFTTPEGETHPMRVRELREVLCGRGIHLVYLNACDTARDATDTANRGVAQALVEAGMPAVIANQYKVLDPSAVAFAERFYWSLACGAPLGQAAREARISLNYSIDGEIIDWAVPVLHARDPDLRLAPRRPGPVPVPPRAGLALKTAVRATTTRRSRTDGPRRIRIAVADLTQAYPGLNDVIPQLNAAQDHAEFVLAKIVLPLGCWREADRSNDGKGKVRGGDTTYLDADLFAQRLINKPSQLGADYLFCIIDRPMKGTIGAKSPKVVSSLYVWGDPQLRHNIFVISTAGFPIPPRGPVTERVFANLLGASVAGDLLQRQIHRDVVHARQPRDCPFFYNPMRDFTQVSGRMRFDANCRGKLVKKVGAAATAAYEAILNLNFDVAR